MSEEFMFFDELKPHMEIVHDEADVTEETGNILEMIADIFVEEGVDCFFTLCSAIGYLFEGTLQHRGIPRVTVRHEQAGGFAADAYGRITGRPGVILTGDGTAAGYVSAAIGQAYAAQSPVVHLMTSQEGGAFDTNPYFGRFDAEHMFKDLGKWARRLDTPSYVLFELKRAFRSAVAPPSGPVTLAISNMAILLQQNRIQPKWNFEYSYNPGFYPPRDHQTQANPAVVEQAMKWLMSAEKPTIIAGEGVHYNDAVEELNEFVALTGIPCHTRRIARGAFSEDNPLNCGGRARGRVMRATDRSVVMGLRVGYLENHGYSPFWSHKARYCQVQTCGENINLTLPTEIEMLGSMKLVLRQMIDCVKAMGITGPPKKWAEWRQFVADARMEYTVRAAGLVKIQEDDPALHPNLLGKTIADFLREELHDDFFLILDGLTASGYTSDWVKAVRSAQILDSAETMGLGHSMGMAIGAGMATKRRVPIVAVVGDGGIGAGGMDIETAARWDIPALFVIFNNSQLGAPNLYLANDYTAVTGDPVKDMIATLPDIRYDEMFKAFGCHGEFVDSGAEIKPALKRAMDYIRDKSKPAVVNCITDPLALHEIWMTLGFVTCFSCIPWKDLPDLAKELIIEKKLVGPQYLACCDPSWVEAIENAQKG